MSDVVKDYLQEIQEDSYLDELGPIALAGIAQISMAAYKLYKTHLSKIARACKNFTGPENNKCRLSFKIKATQKLGSAFKAIKGKCTDEPCKIKMNYKIGKQVDKLAKLNMTLKTVKQQNY